jgi:antitoxin component YwqK of YwqJK toxin-antitoxin module
MAEYLTRFSLSLVVGLAVLTTTVPTADAARPAEPVDRGIMDYPDIPRSLTDLLNSAPTAAVEENDGHTVLANERSPVEVVEERYGSGRIKIRREVTQDEQGNYIRHGSWELWDAKGNAMASGSYRNDQRHGLWSRVYTADEAELLSQAPYKAFRGPFTSQASFKDGKLHGKWIILNNENRIISEWEYVNGLRHGKCVWNYPSGHLMKEMVFHDGLIDGYVRMYDVNSKLLDDETYQQGRKVALKVKYDDAGKIKWEGIYLQSQVVIDSPDDWWNAKPVTYTTTNKNIAKKETATSRLRNPQAREGDPIAIAEREVKHGRWIAWHSNGQIRVEGTYDHGIPEGQFTWWYPNRQKAAVGNYRKGQKHGLWVWWHENGQKSVNGQFTDGQMSGAWAYWKGDGRLFQKSQLAASNSFVLQTNEQEDVGQLRALAPRAMPTRAIPR